MMKDFEKNLGKYARLLVRNGLNIQKGQTLVVRASIKMAEFVRKIAFEAYEAGAKNVHLEYRDEELSLIKYEKAPMEAFKEAPQWLADGMEQMAREGAAFLSLTGEDPDIFKDVDPEKIAQANLARGKSMSAYRKILMSSEAAWCVAAVPSAGWAAKVFPDLAEEEALAKLWDYIFRMTRTYEEDPVQAWKEHVGMLNQKMEKLNGWQLKELHFQSAKTDLRIGLPKDHIWAGGGEYTKGGVYFIANMPTEEIFTAPSKYEVNGHVAATMPLNYSGTLIDDFVLTFREGKVVDMKAEKGYDTLRKLLDTDGGSAYLGEVALVPDDSLISNTKTIYYDTLFDENASCHLAVGAAYPTNVRGAESLSDEELEKIGVNTSVVHVDFMIGSSDMNITGRTESGESIEIFKDGNWAF